MLLHGHDGSESHTRKGSVEGILVAEYEPVGHSVRDLTPSLSNGNQRIDS